SHLCNYAEKRAMEKDGYNIDIDYTKSQMKQIRELISKNDGIQAHYVIQSFKYDEVTSKKSNQVGLYLAKKLAPNQEVTVNKTNIRHTLVKQHLLEKNKISWKDELREAIEYARDNSTNFDSFKRHLNDVYGVETKLRGKTLSFKHPERERFIRANKLGADYE